MLAAFTASSLFLVSYIIYHAQVGSVRFTREVVAHDPRFREVDVADSLTLWERRPD